MSTARTVAVFAIIVGCFAVLYPRIFHPFVVRMFGGQKTSGSETPQYPPTHGRRPDMRKPGDGNDVKSHVRPGPHPGLRAAAEMRQQQQPAGGGRGMMGVVLPMYAVGIVLYLIYTIVKVFSKRQERSETESNSDYGQHSYDKREGKFTYGDDFEAEDDYKDFMNKKEKQKELEKLLLKADERHITEFEMRQLQKRLEETEAQMTRILQAMQTVTEKVDDPTVNGMADKDAGKEETREETKPQTDSTDFSKKEESKDNKTDNTDKSSDSSPDTDSFEVVSKTGSSSFSVISTPTDEDTPSIPVSGEAGGITENSQASDQTQKPSESESTLWKDFEKDVPEDDIDVLSTCKAEMGGVETENIGAFPEDILLDKEKKNTEESSVRQRKPKEL